MLQSLESHTDLQEKVIKRRRIARGEDAGDDGEALESENQQSEEKPISDLNVSPDLTSEEAIEMKDTSKTKVYGTGIPAKANFRCEVCDLPFEKKINLKNHMSSHTKNPKQIKCELCPKEFTRKPALVYHMRSIHPDGAESILDLSSATRVYHCYTTGCNKTFPATHLRDEHIAEIHGADELVVSADVKPFSCDQCPKRFTLSSDLARHLRTHSSERPYQCQECPSAFKQNSHLKTHMRIHTGERPYKCTVCPVEFTQQYSLISHMRTHTGEKPYECRECGKSFKRSDKLKTHAFTLH